MGSPLDPRVRVRDALRALVEETPGRWDKPSLFVLRNRLLDRTGSDARPWAEFLIEALRRGWRERLAGGAMDQGRFDATVAPFVLQWSRERFVQPEMARWALESWAYALRVIDESQLRVAPPPKRESMAAMAARLNAGAATAGAQAAQAARAVARAMSGAPGTPPGATNTAGAAGIGTATGIAINSASRTRASTAAKGRQQPAGGRGTTSGTGHPARHPTSTYTPRTRAGGGRSVPPWIPRALFGTLCAMAMALVGRVAVANVVGKPGDGGRDNARDATRDATRAAGATDRANQRDAAPVMSGAPANSPSAAMLVPVPTPEAATAPLAELRLPANAAPTSARTVSPSLTGGVSIVAPDRPGVPSLTRGLLATGADTTRMVFVQPARRAAGDGRRVATSPSSTPVTFDEMHLLDGTVLQGRVEVVRAGTVIFRDMRTGLRIEYPKDNIAEVITEFGNIVRFRGGAPASARLSATTARSASEGTARGRSAKAAPPTVRTRGVAGVYRIRYAAASAVGSPECTQVWTRPPNAEDIAVVTHIPGADTLAVAFQGGDVFPSNVDPDGYFASTFRIVPDQARTMTALTTRLNGRFDEQGALDLTVNIIFYRRLRVGELTCNVTVKAAGKREK